MSGILDLAVANLLSPMVLFFFLGAGAALLKSDLSVPEAVAKALSLYLMLAIGFKGGASVAAHGLDVTLGLVILAGVVLSFTIPLIAFACLRFFSRLSAVDAAAVAAHYGSISIVTFVAATEAVRAAGLTYEGYLVAVAAAMETPAILCGLWLARKYGEPRESSAATGIDKHLMREILLNGSVVLLLGAFVIGWLTGESGMSAISAFIVDPFKGVLCLFLLDMGLVAGRGLAESRRYLSAGAISFGIYMPFVGAALAGVAALFLGLSVGGAALLMTLAASASYIAVPAAMRIALPDARPGIYVTLSLCITFPFNLTLGIPLYIAVARMLH